MNKIAMMAAVAATALMAVPAVAHAEWYAGAGYTQYQLDDADVGGVTGRVGYRFTPHFAVEGEGTLGVDDDSNAELNGAYGAYAVGTLPIGSSGFDVHGRAGYNQIDVDGTGPQADIDAGGLSYGAGLGWRVGERFGLRADITRTDTDDGDADAISLGGTINF
jgi:hypothetical protein